MPPKNNSFPLIELIETESTNNYAMGLLQGCNLPKGHKRIEHGMAVLAYAQTAGKGQRGNSWHSSANESLSLSIILEPDLLPAFMGFSLLTAVAVAGTSVLKLYIGDDIKIKWPNDLYWQSRKVGGILIETIVKENKFKWAVAGIGVNVNQKQFSESLANPVSLKQIIGKEVEIRNLAIQLQKAVAGAVDQLESDPYFYFDEYNHWLFKRNEKTLLRKNDVVFETFIKGVNQNGQLVTGEQSEVCFDFGTVKWQL